MNALTDLVGAAEISRALRGPEVMIACEKLAKEAVEYAQGIAPVFGNKDPKRGAPVMAGDYPGAYRDSIKAGAPRINGDTVTIRVSTNDPKAWWIEYGSKHMPEYAVFAQTAAAFGGTGPDMASEQVTTAQGILRAALHDLKLAHAMPGHTEHDGFQKAAAIGKAKQAVTQARAGRSAASRAASRGRGGRGGRGRRR